MMKANLDSAEEQAVIAEKITTTEKIPESLLSPAAKKLVAENNIDPARVSGTGGIIVSPKPILFIIWKRGVVAKNTKKPQMKPSMKR